MNQTYIAPGIVQGFPSNSEDTNRSIPASVARDPVASVQADRILVVDDDPDVRRFYAEMLTGGGYRVDTVGDSEAAWALLNAVSCGSDSYDLLITDNNMPKLSGLDLVRKLRAERMALPVILVSGEFPAALDLAVATGASLKTLEWNRSLQIDAALLKPFAVDELLRTVNRVLLAASKPWVGAGGK